MVKVLRILQYRMYARIRDFRADTFLWSTAQRSWYSRQNSADTEPVLRPRVRDAGMVDHTAAPSDRSRVRSDSADFGSPNFRRGSGRGGPSHPLSHPLKHHIEHRYEKDAEKRCSDHAGKYRRADGPPAGHAGT